MRGLHGEYVESSIHDGDGAGDELGAFRHEVVDGATEFLGLSHASKGRLADKIAKVQRRLKV